MPKANSKKAEPVANTHAEFIEVFLPGLANAKKESSDPYQQNGLKEATDRIGDDLASRIAKSLSSPRRKKTAGA